MRNWDWSFPDGRPNLGEPTRFTTETNDGYKIEVILQKNEDGILVCSGLEIDFLDKSKAPNRPINSRFFQLLGFGEILQSARNEYIDWASTLEEAYLDMDAERETRDWPYPGPVGHSDKKYAYLAYMYERYVGMAKENPIDELAQHMNCDRETASSRIAEARNRGLLTRPKQGTIGGKLSRKAKALLEIGG